MRKLFTRFSSSIYIRSVFASAGLFAAACSLAFFYYSGVSTPVKKHKPKEDRPDLARRQDVLRTMDPSLGYVPSERLNHVFNVINQQQAQKGSNPDPLSNASWVERGPSNVGGRTRALMFDPNDGTKKKVWAGGVGGGLWKTNDITVASPVWVNVNSFWANIAVSCIAYAPSSLNTFYVGTGEGWYNVDAIRGNGIWKTTDGGATWNQLASTTGSVFYNVQKIVVTSNGYVYAATRSGGVRRSTDGGTTWAQVLAGAAADLEVGADGTLFATIGIFNAGGTYGIYSSVDGTTWNNSYLSSGDEQRIEIACAPSDANRLYAMVQDNTYALKKIMKSTDKGANWSSVTLPTWCDQGSSDPDMTRGQAWYDLIAAVDPNNANTLFTGGVDVMKSTDAGSTWAQVSRWSTYGGCPGVSMHADQHAIVFAPGSSSIMAFGNDGGVYYTTDALATVAGKNSGYNVTQFYSCAVHPTAGQNYFLAGAQDNGTQKFSSAGMNSTTTVTGGDGAFCFIDQDNPSYQISAYVNNNFYRSTDGGASFSSMTSASGGGFINPADYDDVNNILYSGNGLNTLYRVTAVTGTPATGTITITAMTDDATHIKVSPNTPTTLFVGCADGKVIKVTNANGSPSSASISTGLPVGSVSCIDVGATDNDLLVTYSNYGVTSVWTSSNGGTSWTSREGNLPDMPVRWALRNPNDSKEVFLATEVGIWSTTDVTASSPSWIVNNTGLANVRVDMLQLRNSDKEVIAATHGRGLFSTNVFATATVPTTKLKTGDCGITVSVLNQNLNCDAVSGATTYEFRVINAASSFTATCARPNTSFAMSLVPGIQYAKTYSVTVRAYVGGVWGSYGTVCTVATPASIPGTKLQNAYCGIALTTLGQTLYSDAVAGATTYQFRVIHAASSYTATCSRANTSFAMSLVPGVQYGKTYNVDVRTYVGGVWSGYGSVCTVTTPASIPGTKLQTAYCNSSLTTLNQLLYCDAVGGATTYEYRVTHPASGFTRTCVRANNSFAMSLISGVQYGKTYNVEVRVYVAGVWSSYGIVCTVTTPPSIPSTNLQICGIALTTMNQILYCNAVAGATTYQYRVIHPVSSFTATCVRANNSFAMSLVPGVQNNTMYQVDVRTYVGGVWSNYGPMCPVLTPGGIADPGDHVRETDIIGVASSIELFTNTVVGNEVSLALNGATVSGEMMVEIRNVIGERMDVSRFEYAAGDVIKLPIDERYTSGVYFITAVINNEKIHHKFIVNR